MTRSQPDRENVHAAGQRDHGIVGQAQQDQAHSAQVAHLPPDWNCEQGMEMEQHSGFKEFTG
jgi:hypothetical protein